MLFGFRNAKGDINQGFLLKHLINSLLTILSDIFLNIEDLEVPPILTTKTDAVVWSIFPEFGNKKEENNNEEPVEE